MNSFQILPVLDTLAFSEEEGYQHGPLPRALGQEQNPAYELGSLKQLFLGGYDSAGPRH